MTDTPPRYSIERVWLVQATYAPDAAETRVPFRPRHLARIAELKAAGVIVEAGAFMDVSSSLILRPRRSEEAALEIAPPGRLHAERRLGGGAREAVRPAARIGGEAPSA